MVRIKGANSDYRFDPQSQQIQEVKPPPNPVYLDLYVCPYDMPSPIEPPEDGQWCEGRDRTCPHSGEKSGHALVQVHQKNGVSLVADNNNQIVVDQQGHIRLQPAAGQVEIGQDAAHTLQLQYTEQGWDIQLPDGPRIHLSTDGSIQLHPNPQGQVKVTGSLHIDGDLYVNNQQLTDQITALDQRLKQLEGTG